MRRLRESYHCDQQTKDITLSVLFIVSYHPYLYINLNFALSLLSSLVIIEMCSNISELLSYSQDQNANTVTFEFTTPVSGGMRYTSATSKYVLYFILSMFITAPSQSCLFVINGSVLCPLHGNQN